MHVPETRNAADIEESASASSPLVLVRRVYTRFLQGLFHACPPGHYHWEPDASSEIVISGALGISSATLGDRPCVTVLRAPMAVQTLGFDDVSQHDLRTGTKQRATLMPGAVTINVCTRNDVEADTLAGWITDHLVALRDYMLRQGFFHVGHNLQINAPTPPGGLIKTGEAEEWFCMTIVSPFMLSRLTQTSPLARDVLRAFEATIHTAGAACATEGPAALGGLPQVSETPAVSNGLPRVAHPLDPTRVVTVRQVRPYGAGVRVGGRLPLPAACVGDSSYRSTTRVKA